MKKLLTLLFLIPVCVFADGPRTEGKFYSSPILLNGKSHSEKKAFMLDTKGILEFAIGDPDVASPHKIPFKVTLMRMGEVVTTGISIFQVHTSLDIATVLAYAREGDELIIQPVSLAFSQSRKVVKILSKGC